MDYENLSKNEYIVENVSVEAGILNDIFAASLQFGEKWRRPIIEWVKELYTYFEPNEQEILSSYIEKVRKNIEDFICVLYYEKHEKNTEIIERDTKTLIAKEYPWMNSDNVSHMVSQGIYYAWRG